MNFVETCRKGAGWPSLHRDVPQKKEGARSWSMSQEELAGFVGQVRSRSDDLISELRSKDERIAKLADEKADMAKELSKLAVKLAAHEFADRIKARATSMGLEADQAKQLSDVAA